VSARTEARAHLRKSAEFLTAAELAVDLELFNAAASNAVTSGINAKDAICLVFTGETGKTDHHLDAVAELRSAGVSMGPHATTLGRLLRLKTRSQYQATDVSPTDAQKAVEWARRLHAAAREAVTA